MLSASMQKIFLHVSPYWPCCVIPPPQRWSEMLKIGCTCFDCLLLTNMGNQLNCVSHTSRYPMKVGLVVTCVPCLQASCRFHRLSCLGVGLELIAFSRSCAYRLLLK